MNAATQSDLGKLVLRLALGILILLHGIAKLKGGTAGIVGMVEGAGLPGVLGYAVLIGEVLAPLMVIAGFHARIGAALIAINMIVAVALAHMGELASLGQSGGWALDLQGKVLFTAIALVVLGPGRFSVNQR